MIPVFEPQIGPEEIEGVVAALQRGEISGNFGQALDEFEAKFAERVGCSHGVAASSGTGALHLAVSAAGIGPGDEVIVSSATNIATGLAPAYCGALPVPADSLPDTWNIDPDHVEALITPRTRAIIAVHLLGAPADMHRIMAIAERHNLFVIEDAAQAHGAMLDGRPVGSFGHIATYSFYANKIVTTGEGGMATTGDAALAARMRLLRNMAFTRPRFRHEEIGFNYRMAGYQAAMGLVQLAKIDRTIAARRATAAEYRRHLADIAEIQWQAEPEGSLHVHWMSGLRLLPGARLTRDALAAGLAERGIETRTFFCPMNQQPCLQQLPGFRAEPCPVADGLWESGLYLPTTPTLSADDLAGISAAVRELLVGSAAA